MATPLVRRPAQCAPSQVWHQRHRYVIVDGPHQSCVLSCAVALAVMWCAPLRACRSTIPFEETHPKKASVICAVGGNSFDARLDTTSALLVVQARDFPTSALRAVTPLFFAGGLVTHHFLKLVTSAPTRARAAGLECRQHGPGEDALWIHLGPQGQEDWMPRQGMPIFGGGARPSLQCTVLFCPRS